MSSNCDDHFRSQDLAQASKGYRRAPLLVVGLNLTTGLVEIVGGSLASSQALEADALDFLGDGTITFPGLIAITRGPGWRASAALLQGVFLSVLGIIVIGGAVHRAIDQKLPDSEVMTWIGIVALSTNVACTLILMSFRKGDASVRAVWLFTRNDAVGNLAVIVAAGLVAWTASPWPDLVTAGLVGGLFLHSALEILRDTRNELRARASSA